MDESCAHHLELAAARIEQLEAAEVELIALRRSFAGHVYVKSEEYAAVHARLRALEAALRVTDNMIDAAIEAAWSGDVVYSDDFESPEAMMRAALEAAMRAALDQNSSASCSGCAGITHTHTCGDPAKQPQLDSSPAARQENDDVFKGFRGNNEA
jgi:hypothetical protein